MHARFLFVGILSIGSFFLAWSASAIAQPIAQTYAISVDAYMDSYSPTTNYGNATTAKVVGYGTAGSHTRALFEVPAEVWSVPQADLISAKVWFCTYQDLTGGREVRLNPLSRGFVETGTTWNSHDGVNAWTNAGGDYDGGVFVDAVKGTNWFSWDITTLWNNTDLRSFGAILRMSDESNPGDGSMPRAPFYSSDYATISQRPYVEVTYVPEAGTLWAISVPLGLGMLRWRR